MSERCSTAETERGRTLSPYIGGDGGASGASIRENRVATTCLQSRCDVLSTLELPPIRAPQGAFAHVGSESTHSTLSQTNR